MPVVMSSQGIGSWGSERPVVVAMLGVGGLVRGGLGLGFEIEA